MLNARARTYTHSTLGSAKATVHFRNTSDCDTEQARTSLLSFSMFSQPNQRENERKLIVIAASNEKETYYLVLVCLFFFFSFRPNLLVYSSRSTFSLVVCRIWK